MVKPLEDINHIIAQGQENTARADLTFIEKSLFAKKLLSSGISKDDIKRALTVDDSLLSRMLSVVEGGGPAPVLDTIGAARGIGRDRWEQLKKELQHPAKVSAILEQVSDGVFEATAGEQRFAAVLDAVMNIRRSRKPTPARASERNWSLAQDAVKVATKSSRTSFTLALKAKDASGFGAYLSEQLERIYEEYQQQAAS